MMFDDQSWTIHTRSTERPPAKIGPQGRVHRSMVCNGCNVRGTVGLSTRGRDTGDGQIYINTVDNVWLDHEYTVMATITSGVEAFDRMQEGARIRRITILP